MDPEAALDAILRRVAAGGLSPEAAGHALRATGYADLGFARLDTLRAARTGLPEVVYAEGKQPEQCLAIARRLHADHGRVLLTRVDPATAALLRGWRGDLRYNPLGRTAVVAGQAGAGLRSNRPARAEPPEPLAADPPQAATDAATASPAPGARVAASPEAACDAGRAPVAASPPAPGPAGRSADGRVLVVAAGTADLPVAEEAAETAAFCGCEVARLTDVGIAGLHRLLAEVQALRDADAIIVVAGMEGALPGVVAALTDRPVVAVPASVGYGVARGGFAALLTMLASCAPGMAVVNIDNGFGAAVMAHRIARRARS